MAVPVRQVLVIGGEEAGAKHLIQALTTKLANVSLPCKHRMKFEGEGLDVVQADLEIWHQKDPLKLGEAEPKKPDVMILCYHAFKEETTNTLNIELWKEKIRGIEVPKLLVGTGLEECVPHFMAEEEQDSTAENPEIFSAASLAGLSTELGACAAFEVATRYSRAVRDLFSHALRAAVAPAAASGDTSPAALLSARRALLSALINDPRKIGVPVKPQKLPKTQDDKQAEEVFSILGRDQKWERKPKYFKNIVTGLKEKPPADHDADMTLKDRAKEHKKRYEREINKLRRDQMNQAEDERLVGVREAEIEHEADFATTVTNMLEKQASLKQLVAELQVEHDAIKEEQAKNETRGDELQNLSDLRARKDAVIQQRVEEDIDHERKMAALHEELKQLQNTDFSKHVKAETFEAATIENRRLQQHLRGILEESQGVRLSIKKVKEKTRSSKANIDEGTDLCMKAEARIQRSRNNAVALKEDVTQLKTEKEWHVNALFLRRNAEMAVAQQLRDWKREGRVLRAMIRDIDDKTAEQEVPIARYLTEEKKRARLRGGPLLLDDEDVLDWRHRRHFAGEYKPPSDKQLMQRLHTEHDRLLLEYHFLCADLAEKAVVSDEALDSIKASLRVYVDSERDTSAAGEQITETLHRLLLLLDQIMRGRRGAIRRLQRKEDTCGEGLVTLQMDSDALLEESARGGSVGTYSSVSEVREAQEEVRGRMYTIAEEAERMSCLRRDQVKALRAVATQKQRVVERLRQREEEAESEESGASTMYRDVMSIIEVAEATLDRSTTKEVGGSQNSSHMSGSLLGGPSQRTFLNKALQGLHQDTQALVVKRCTHRKPLGSLSAPETLSRSVGLSKQTSRSGSTSSPKGSIGGGLTRRSLGLSGGPSRPKQRGDMSQAGSGPPARVAGVSVTGGGGGGVGQKAKGAGGGGGGGRTQNRYDSLVSSLSQEFGLGSRGGASRDLEKGWKKLW